MARAKTATIDLKLRMKEPLRAQIERAAKNRGVSLNAEMVRRLEASFETEKSQSAITAEAVGGVYALFGSINTFMVARLLSQAITTIEAVKEKEWTNDPEVFRAVRSAAIQILNVFAPSAEGKAKISSELASLELMEAESKRIGADAAKTAVEAWLHRIHLVAALKNRGKTG